MNTHIRWAKLFAACGGAAFASRLRRTPHNEKQAHKAELHEWENEGGNLARSPETTDALVTTVQPDDFRGARTRDCRDGVAIAPQLGPAHSDVPR